MKMSWYLKLIFIVGHRDSHACIWLQHYYFKQYRWHAMQVDHCDNNNINVGQQFIRTLGYTSHNSVYIKMIEHNSLWIMAWLIILCVILSESIIIYLSHAMVVSSHNCMYSNYVTVVFPPLHLLLWNTVRYVLCTMYRVCMQLA